MKMEVGGGGRELEERKEDRKEQFLGTRRDGTRRDETEVKVFFLRRNTLLLLVPRW